MGWDFDTNQESGTLDVGTGSLYISSDDAAGDNTREANWGVANVDFGMTVSVGKKGTPGTAIAAGSDTMTLSWTAVDGATYRIMATTNLIEGLWVEMTNGISGSAGLISVTNVTSGSRQFFRIDYEDSGGL
jgi:hypothetical protein